MTKFKRLLSCGLIAASAFALASCDGGEDEVIRNTTVPYGSITNDVNVASATGITSLGQKFYYDRLRSKSYDTLVTLIKTEMLQDQVTAVYNLITKSYSDLSAQDKVTLSLTTDPIDEETYNHLKKRYSEKISDTFASSFFGTTSAKAYNQLTEEEKESKRKAYVESMGLQGYTFDGTGMAAPVLDLKTDKITVDIANISYDILEPVLLTQAQTVFAEKKLYEIADKEYITEVGTDGEEKESKNAYYYFNDLAYKQSYTSTFYTEGTYQAIIIPFNSRREATEAVENILTARAQAKIEDNAAEFYVDLYNNYYSYKGAAAVDINDAAFTYTVNSDVDDFKDIPSQIKTFVTESLDAGKYLTEARNINGKYVMAYHVSTTFDVNDGTDTSKQLSYDLLKKNEAKYNAMLPKIKRNIIESNSSAYVYEAMNDAFEALCDQDNPANSKLKIYDPYLEYRFNYSYTDSYALITPEIYTADNKDGKYVFALNDTKYTVTNFFDLCSKRLGSQVLTDYLLYEYALKYVDDLVDEDTQKSNKESLETSISEFNKGNNSTYPKEIGEDTFLLANYGYANKDDVLKYALNATNALTAYKNKKVFTEWAKDGKVDDTKVGDLKNILNTGNEEYSKLFSIDLQHILIFIDDDSDGSPDDPSVFLKKLNDSAKETEFKNAVVELARAIYTEATNEAYSENKLNENLKFIVAQYNKGAALLSNPGKTWDDYKKFNFLLKVEDLSGNGDDRTPITQDSVNNFVKSFADYVKELFNICAEKSVALDKEKGTFVLPKTADFAGGAITADTDITIDTLCTTSFGYHMIFASSYTKPQSLKFTAEDDENSGNYKSAIELVLKAADEDDEDSKDISIIMDAHNDSTDKASFNQFFVYYVQSKLGNNPSIDESMRSVLVSLFTEAIDKYESSAFQNMMIFDNIKPTSVDTGITATLSLIRQNFASQITGYDSTSKFADWCDSTKTTWARPDAK